MELFGITLTEFVGYLASIMVLISFTMKDVKKLRTVNMMGCLLFVVYGFLMPTLRIGLPIIITNIAIFCINYYWSKLKPSNNLLGLIRVKSNNKISIAFEKIDNTKTYYYKFLGEQEHYTLILNKRNNLFISSIIFTGNKDTMLTIYEDKYPIMSFKIKTK